MSKARILIVEDERIVAADLKFRLAKMGYEVIAVLTRGEDAVEQLSALQPDLILMDISLEGEMDGIRATEIIRKTQNLPIIYLSGHSDKQTLDRAKVTGPLGYIIKPFGNRELQISIEMALYRHNIEKKLHDTEQWLALTLRSIWDAVISTDALGRVKFLNLSAEEIIGYKQEEVVGKELNQFICFFDENDMPLGALVDTVLGNGESFSLPSGCLLQGKKKKRISVESSVAPIKDDFNKLSGAVLVFQDITEKQRMEREFMRSQKLESIGLLAGGIAHDFNNIITAIVGNLALARLKSRSSNEVGLLLNKAENAALRARDLTQQLLTFSKGGEPIKKLFYLNNLLPETILFALSGSNVGVELDLPEDLWPVEADEGQLNQVFNNLIINADQAMPDGGKIHLLARNYLLEYEDRGLPPGEYVLIKVQDNGPGIEYKHLNKIFDPYFTTKAKGNGLGLTTVYSIIKRHGGIVRVYSAPNQGTSFDVFVPACPDCMVKEPQQDQDIVLGEGRILIMDDEEVLLEVTSEILESLGYSAVCVADGKEAIAAYKQAMREGKPFQAVIMDLTIPGGMGGKTAIKKLLAVDPYAVAIVSSGYSNDQVMARYQDFGFKGVIVKPYSIKDLSQVLTDCINPV